jgi:hypothetical protein
MGRNPTLTAPRERATAEKWGVLAEYLIDVEKRLQSDPKRSFSAFIRDYAKKCNRQPSSLWRLLSAGKYYQELRSSFKQMETLIPDLGDSRLAASPESLELLNKISRVAPPNLKELQHLTLLGAISRRDLRDLWITFRPVLAGRTARGRDAERPKYNRLDESMSEAHATAQILNSIRLAGPHWMGSEKGYIYRVLPTSSVSEFERIKKTNRNVRQFFPDAFVIYAPGSGDHIQVHAISVLLADKDLPNAIRSSILMPKLDGFWFATSTKPLTPHPLESFSRLFIKPIETKDKMACLLPASTYFEAKGSKPVKDKTSRQEATVSEKDVYRALLEIALRAE